MSALGKIDEDTVAYDIAVTDDRLQIQLTLISGTPINETMFLSALIAYVDDMKNDIDNCFTEARQLFRDEH